MSSEWILYSERKPESAGVYEWRVPSKAVPGVVLIVAAHMRMRGAGYTSVLSPTFDYWDGYQVHVMAPVEWRQTDAHGDIKTHESKVIRIEGLDPCDCIYCGKSPRLEAYQRYSGGGVVVGPSPWNLNDWRFVCCAWGSTPWRKDPREIERVRREAIARACSGTAELARIATDLARISEGLNNSNSGAEDKACRLADEARAAIAKATGEA